MIAGHTDAVGGDAFNQNLSERRAHAIKQYLTEKYGVAGSDLVTVGYGKSKLKDPSTPTAPVNRRSRSSISTAKRHRNKRSE